MEPIKSVPKKIHFTFDTWSVYVNKNNKSGIVWRLWRPYMINDYIGFRWRIKNNEVEERISFHGKFVACNKQFSQYFLNALNNYIVEKILLDYK